MKRIISLMILAAFASTAFLISFSSDAEAVPSFARKEGAECTLCHVGFPKLNSFGYEYKQRGYRMADTDGIWVWENPMQFAGMAAIGYEFMDMEQEATGKANGDMETSKIAIGELEFFVAGNLAPKISFFLDIGYEDGDSTLDRGETFVIFNDILPDSLLNIKVGEFKTQLYWLSSSRKLGMTGYLGGGHGTFWETVEVGVKKLADDEDMGHELESFNKGIGYSGRAIEINGILPTGTRYAIGGGNDTTMSDTGMITTDNSITKVFAVLEQEIEFFGETQRIGFVWVGDRIGQDNDNNMLGMPQATKDTDRTNLYGASVDMHLPIGLEQPLNLIFAYFYYDDELAGGENTGGVNEIESDYNHFIVEAILPIGEKIILEGLYERVDLYTLGNSADTLDNDIDFYRVGASLHYYFAPNVDLIFDYSHDDADVNLGANGSYDLNQDMFMVMLHLGF